MKEQHEPPSDFEKEILEHVQAIDESLSQASVPIPDRALRAAVFFVEHAIVDIRGDTKDDFTEKPWFAFIYQTMRRWYEHRYGGAADREATDALAGALVFRGAAFRLAIPATRSRIEEEGKTCWLHFPAKVWDDEDALEWIVRPPNLDALDTGEERDLREQASLVAAGLRVINCDLMTVDCPDDESARWAKDVIAHLEQAAEIITSAKSQPTMSKSCWHSHQAAESVLKLLCRQKTGTHPHTHELSKLCDSLGSTTVIRSLVDPLPSQSEVISMRANEIEIDLGQAISIYRDAISLVAHCTDLTSRKTRVRDAGFLIRKAPWIDDSGLSEKPDSDN